ncbi:MAG: thioredoxin family protein [bacterium]
MPLISETLKKKSRELLAKLSSDVKLVLFTQEMECAHCREARAVAEEVAGLSDRLSLEVHDLVLESEPARRYGVDKVPALCVVGADDPGIRFFGVPSGYEYTSLLAAIDAVGRADSSLSPQTRARLAELAAPVGIQVFVTLSCPLCPMMVALAHRFAVESSRVTAAAVDAGEFPQLANLYDVTGVPRTIINRTVSLEGVVPEARLLEAVFEAAAT